MNHKHIYFRSMLKRAMGDETGDLFSINAGLRPFEMYDILQGSEIPDRDTLLKIAAHAKNGVTYEMLKEAMKDDEKAVIDDDDRDTHYLLYTREEDLEKYFQKISRSCNGDSMNSDVWFLIWMLDELKDQDDYVEDKYKSEYSAEYTGEKRLVGNRVYRDVKFTLPDGNLEYIVKGTASWLPENNEEISDCRFHMSDVEKQERQKTMHDRIHELRQDLKDYCEKAVEENTCNVPSVQEGYGFYIDDDHLEEAKAYCEAHRDLWPNDLEKVFPWKNREMKLKEESQGRKTVCVN